MRIGSAFLKARDDKEDRIQKRRSDNMAAFNSYVQTQSELGVNASVQDLEQMKQNLAGGDFYYGKQLPSSNVIEETSARLGAIQADKDANMASTRLANQNKVLANLQLGLAGFIGTKRDDAWWEKNKDLPQLKSVIDVYGSETAKTYLNMQDQNAVAKYIQDYNLQTFKTYDGIEAAIAQAPVNFQDKIRSYLSANLERWKATQEDVAELAVSNSMSSILKGALTEDDAISGALAVFNNAKNSKLVTTSGMTDAITELAREAFKQRLKPLFKKAVTKAQSIKNPDYANNDIARAAAVASILDDGEIVDDGSREVERLKEQLNRSLKVGADDALSNVEDEKINALRAKIAGMSFSDFDHLTSSTMDAAETQNFIASMGIDLTGTRYVNEKGEPTVFMTQLRQMISALVTRKADVARIDVDDANTDKINALIFGGATGGAAGEGQTEAMRTLLTTKQGDNDRVGKIFNEVNRIRLANGKPAFADQTDEDWKKIWAVLSDRIGMAQIGHFNTTIKTATEGALKIVQAAEEDAETFMSLIVGKDEDTGQWQTANYIVGKYFIPAVQNDKGGIEALMYDVADMLERKGLDMSVETDRQEARYQIDLMMKARGIHTKIKGQQNAKQAYIQGQIGNLVKPDSSVADWARPFIDGSARQWAQFSTAYEQLAIDADPATIKQATENLAEVRLKWMALYKELDRSLKRPEVHELLRDGHNSQPALMALRDEILGRLKAIDELKLNGDPSYLIRNPEDGTFKVNPKAPGRAAEFGHKEGVIYKRDPDGTFSIDQVKTQIAQEEAGVTVKDGKVVSEDGGVVPEPLDPLKVTSKTPIEVTNPGLPEYGPLTDYTRGERKYSRSSVAEIRDRIVVHPKLTRGEQDYINQNFNSLTADEKPIVSAILRSEKMAAYLNGTYKAPGEWFGGNRDYNGHDLKSLFDNPMAWLQGMAEFDVAKLSSPKRPGTNQDKIAAGEQARHLLRAISEYRTSNTDPRRELR